MSAHRPARAAYLSRGGPDASLAAVVYQGVFEGMSLSFGVLFWWCIRRKHLKITLTPSEARAAVIRFGTGDIAYLGAIGVAVLSAPASLLISGLVAVYYVFEQTPGRPADTRSGRRDNRISGDNDGQPPAQGVPGPGQYRAR